MYIKIVFYRRLMLYTERQRQCCDVASDIALNKLLRFLNKPSRLLQKIGFKPNWSDMTSALMLQVNH